MPAYARGQIVEPVAVGIYHQMAKWAFFGKSQFCRPTTPISRKLTQNRQAAAVPFCAGVVLSRLRLLN